MVPRTVILLLIAAALSVVDAASLLGLKPSGKSYFNRQWPRGESSFTYNFVESQSLPKDFWGAGPWANGQPFNCGWKPNQHYFHDDDGLTLLLERKQFVDPGTKTGGGRTFPYTSGEVRSRSFYGYGTYSVCMKPAKVSGTSASFYVHNGPYDTPSDAGRWYNDHNEIDVEFIGVNTTVLQTNFFSRPKIPTANSASGNEMLHYLGFDAADQFAVYTFRWTHGKIEWFVNGKPIRTETWQSSKPIPLQSYSTCRVVANVWPVNKQAEEWAGPLDGNFEIASAKYKWMQYDADNGPVPTGCDDLR